MKKLFLRTGIRYGLFQGLIVVSTVLLLLTSTASAFDSGSTGALGAFNPQANIEVDISLYPDGKLNYTTVNIPTGVTVTFKKNAANTPVYILATGDVTIAGTISVNGKDGSGIYPGVGGPGGFNGGLGGTIGVEGGKGLGPGGGNPDIVSNYDNTGGGGGGGGYESSGGVGMGLDLSTGCNYFGGSGGSTYGNSKIFPMIGGSGGGGGGLSSSSNCSGSAGGGGGGGGAVLIASSGTITVTGSITANGGNGVTVSTYCGGGGGGSGGAIKLMANTISGEGTISASGGYQGTSYCASGGAGGNGRIRFEANTVTRTGNTSPLYTYSYPSTVFVTNIPTLSITTIGGIHVSANPTGKYGSPDVTLPSNISNPVTVEVSATNIPVGTQVTVTAVPEYGSSTSTSGALSGTDALSTASASITLSSTYQSILTATATFTIQTAMYWDDEKIEKVRVATTMGKGSEVTYITEKGREIKAELLAGLMRR